MNSTYPVMPIDLLYLYLYLYIYHDLYLCLCLYLLSTLTDVSNTSTQGF